MPHLKQTKTVRGGGQARKPILKKAIALIGAITACFACATPATAADSEGHDLYIWKEDQLIKIPSEVKFTQVISDNRNVCARSVEGKSYWISAGTKEIKASDSATYSCGAPTSVYLIPGFSARGSALFSRPETLRHDSTIYTFYIRNLVSVDAEGRAWTSPMVGTQDTVNWDGAALGLAQVPQSEEVEWFGAAAPKDNTSGGSFAVFLGSPRPAQSNSYAGQLPQSGDPAAAWTQILPYVVAVCAVGGAVVVSRSARRRA